MAQLVVDQNGQLDYNFGLERCSDKDSFRFEQIHLSSFRVYSQQGRVLFVNSSKQIILEDPAHIQPSKPDEQIAFFYRYDKFNTSATFTNSDLMVFRAYGKEGKLIADKETAYDWRFGVFMFKSCQDARIGLQKYLEDFYKPAPVIAPSPTAQKVPQTAQTLV